MRSAAPPDPFASIYDRYYPTCYKQTAGLARRSAVINPALKTLVLIVVGQSQGVNITPSTYVPVNTAKIDQFNIFDGELYQVNGAMLGCTFNEQPSSYGVGNVVAQLVDNLTTYWDRVIVAPIGVGGSSIAQWGLPGGDVADSSGTLYKRGPITLRRLAAKGITPATAGVTFASLMLIGESDNVAGTSQANFQLRAQGYMDAMTAAGFSGRFFFTQESWYQSATSATVRAGQAALVNGTTVFSAGDLDTLNNTNRFDTTHFNDTGRAAAASIIANAMHASGAPF